MVKIISSKFFLILTCLILLAVGLTAARSPIGRFLRQKGLEAERNWELEKADRYFEWAARLQSDDVRVRLEKGLNLQLRGDFLAAHREFEILAKRKIEDPAFEALLLNALGVDHFNFNEADRAIELHRESLELARRIKDQGLQARALIDLSRVLYHSKGKGDEAQRNLEEALELARRAGDERDEADALRNLGAIFWWHGGERDRPLAEFYFPALDLYRRNNDLHGEAVALSNISLAYREKGDAFQFLKYQTESVAIKEKIGDLAGLSDSYLYLSWYYIRLRNLRKAGQYIGQSLELSRRIGYRLGQNEAEASLVLVYKELREFDKAVALLEELLERDRANPILYKYRLGALGLIHQLKGDPLTARRYYEESAELNKRAGNETEINLLNKIAETYQETNDWDRAEEYLLRAEKIGLGQAEKNWVYWFDNRRALARQMEHRGRFDEALRYLLEAAEIETGITGSNEASPLQGEGREIYDHLFALILKNPAPSPADDRMIFRLAEQMRYRAFKNLIVRVGEPQKSSATLIEKERTALRQLRKASEDLKTENDPLALESLRRAYGNYEDSLLRTQLNEPNYQLVQDVRPAEPEDVRRALDKETALIEYLYSEEKVFALIITDRDLRSVELPVSKTELIAAVKLFRWLIFSGAGNIEREDWLPAAENLGRILIRPLEETNLLAGKRKLGFVPFGFLRDLPLAALVTSSNGDCPDGRCRRFLIEDHAIFHLPSAAFLTKRTRRAEKSDTKIIYSIGRNASDEENLPPLKRAEDEAADLAGIFGAKARVGELATETDFKQNAPHHRYIHIATHAVSEEMLPLLSRLKLRATAEDDGNLTVREIFNLHLAADLVTLGACRTGQGFSSSGSPAADVDRISLFEAFLYAGSSSVLAASAPIEDGSTPAFMRFFYANLRTRDKAESLAAAQKAALRGELTYRADGQTRRLTHPRYWATFIIYGDHR
ncbi:MAG: CHAT domain-containing protein [Pyrinomonadaceae bacterium]